VTEEEIAVHVGTLMMQNSNQIGDPVPKAPFHPVTVKNSLVDKTIMNHEVVALHDPMNTSENQLATMASHETGPVKTLFPPPIH